MSIKNIVTGQLAKVTTYTGAGQVTDVSTTGNITTAANLVVGGVSELGPVGNVAITGGNVGEVLSTDGTGNLSWTPNPIYVVPPVYLVATAAGNNQSFSNTVLASYNSNTDMTVFYNGSLLENTYYTLAGDVLTVNIPLQVGDGIDVVTTVSSNVNSIVTSAYGNSNVAAYLPTYIGSLPSLTGDVTTTANVTATKVSLGTGNLQLVGNTVSSAASIITIDPLGDGTPAGNVVVAGNLQVSGTLTYNDVVNATTNDLQWIAANNAVNPPAATGAGLSVGPAGAYASFTYNAGSNVWQSSLPLLANGGVNANGALSGATTGSFTGNVTADYFIGNGSQLTGLAPTNQIAFGASNVSIPVNNGNITQYVNGIQVARIAADRIALGDQAGETSQGANSIAIGTTAGQSAQGIAAVAIGLEAGQTNQRNYAVAIGIAAGNSNQGISGVAIGELSGSTNQSQNATAVGRGSGRISQGLAAVAVGSGAGQTNQGQYSIAIGQEAGVENQLTNSVAIGFNAGYASQGANAIAIGTQAGRVSQPSNSIILNATGAILNGTNSGLYAAPIRNDSSNITNGVYYNTATKELTYGTNTPAVTVKGSWTVVPGEQTYTFSIPLGSAFNVTVIGRIPNGIITYQGQLCITNDNVAATGWWQAVNYTGGGTPLRFVQVPPTIGAMNSIVNSDMGGFPNPSSTLRFVINNTSGSNQPVDWSYVKVT